MFCLNNQILRYFLALSIFLTACRTEPTITPTSPPTLTPLAESVQNSQVGVISPSETPIPSPATTRLPATRQPTFTPGPPLPVQDASVAFLVPDQTGPNLWIGNLDGSGMWEIEANVVGYPFWSPDGQWLAYQRGRDAWIIRRDGTEAQVIFAHDQTTGHSYPYAWLPDGTLQIMWAEYNTEEAPYELTDFQYIDRQLPLIQSNNLRTQSLLPMSGFAWTPDGTLLARLNLFGNALTLQQHPSGDVFSRPIDINCGGAVVGMAWSPDGQWLAQWRSGNGRYGTMRICLSQPLGTDIEIPISQTSKPVWSTNSQSIYFFNHYPDPDETERLPEPQIMQYDVNTAQLTSLHLFPETTSHLGDIAVSPDGQWLAVPIRNWQGETPTNDFFVFHLQTGEWHEWHIPALMFEYSARFQFSWHPDSHTLIFPTADGYFSALDVLDGTTSHLLGPIPIVDYWIVSPMAGLP